MSFSSLGPRVWVPRRLGLGETAIPGGYVLPSDAGTLEAGIRAGAKNYATQMRAEAQGYVSRDLANGARTAFRQNTGVELPYVPVTLDQNVIGKWAKDQAAAWGSATMRQGIDAAKRSLALQGVPENHAGYAKALTQDESAEWCIRYLTSHPSLISNPNAEGAIAMAQAFVLAQGDAIGIPPEFIAAANLAQNFPTDIESAEKWAVTLGTAYLSRFGVPLVTSLDATAFVQAAGRFGMSQVSQGVPFALCEATFSALSDGVINYAEAKGLIVGACAWIGGAIGQMFGIPAPLGAILGNIIGEALIIPVAEALGFGPSDSEKLWAAQSAARDAAAAQTIVCTDMARALWLQYQQYWDSVQGNLEAVFHANQEWLTPKGCGQGAGVRLFPSPVPGSNELEYVLDRDGHPVTVKGKPLQYQRPVSRSSESMTGIAYNYTRIDPIVMRADYDLNISELDEGRIPDIRSVSPGCDVLSALAFWNARRFVTPMQAYYAMRGSAESKKQCYTNYCVLAGSPNMWLREYESRGRSVTGMWERNLHSDKEYLEYIGRVAVTGEAGTEVGECLTPEWAAYLMGSLQQAPAASALVQRDLARTVSYVTTQYGLQKHMEELAGAEWRVASLAQQRQAARQAAARAASFRNAVREAKRRGRLDSDMLNYSLLAAGGAALAGWITAKRMR